MSRPVPAYLPRLDRHAHLRPEDGACLMELVAVLGGRRFNDRPAGTHPLLAVLARAVNDTLSNAARPALATLAPDLVNLSPTDPAAGIAVVERCLAVARAAEPGSRSLRRHTRATRRHAGRIAFVRRHPLAVRLLHGVWSGAPAERAVEAAVRSVAAQPDADSVLHRLLVECIGIAKAFKRAAGQSGGHPSRSPGRPFRDLINLRR